MNPNEYFRREANKSLGVLKIMQSGWEIFTSSSVSYVAGDFKKVVSDLSHADSTVIETKENAV